ncbi:hypothetical protein F5X68DRAFT_38826 [Plectosphaerella plurivora]|uniref:Uncharacterized protein n=1 Tax=Plectosphaerella plurivora TaxID=936078 RepID=A0A9P9A7G7_9PEZI|nr:hypothetical protein F5X68DRAFT_38826 [Plectosphaerella plurivora]
MTTLPSEVRLGDEEAGHDGAADSELKRQRRRIQKRKTQRARRHRLGENKPAGGQDPRPYRVDCWRLDEVEESPSLPANATPDDEYPSLEPTPSMDAPLIDRDQPLAVPSMAVASRQLPSGSAFIYRDSCVMTAGSFPLSADHLLHIIQFNVLIGLKSNKNAIGVWSHCRDGRTPLPDRPGVPDTLMPTALQMDQYHSVWIDMIPFPGMRDNLIRWEGYFSHREFLRDLVGETATNAPLSGHACWNDIRKSMSTMTIEVTEDCADKDQQGLIVWGEAHELSSWELTPGFLAKWMWAIEGCEKLLVESSNRWRLARGDEPMRLTAKGSRAILGS